MKNKNTQKLTLAAMVAAAYAVLSLLGAVFGITYGPIQVRFSEALCLLPFLFPETAWGLGVGCLIANLFSPYGVLDIVVGSLATLIAALITSRCRNVWLAALPPVACNMVLVGPMSRPGPLPPSGPPMGSTPSPWAPARPSPAWCWGCCW